MLSPAPPPHDATPSASSRLRVHFVRHPRTSVPHGVCYGASDVELEEDASTCAARIQAQLPFGAPVFSSPLRRCRALAEHLHPSVVFEPRLAELNFGAWELRPWSEIPFAELDAWAAAPLDFRPPGGETVRELWARVGEFLAELRAAGDLELVVVSHAGVAKAFTSHLEGLPLGAWMGAGLDFGAVKLFDTGVAPSDREGAS
jgi:alpha-ribazole phosphatase